MLLPWLKLCINQNQYLLGSFHINWTYHTLLWQEFCKITLPWSTIHLVQQLKPIDYWIPYSWQIRLKIVWHRIMNFTEKLFLFSIWWLCSKQNCCIWDTKNLHAVIKTFGSDFWPNFLCKGWQTALPFWSNWTKTDSIYLKTVGWLVGNIWSKIIWHFYSNASWMEKLSFFFFLFSC